MVRFLTLSDTTSVDFSRPSPSFETLLTAVPALASPRAIRVLASILEEIREARHPYRAALLRPVAAARAEHRRMVAGASRQTGRGRVVAVRTRPGFFTPPVRLSHPAARAGAVHLGMLGAVIAVGGLATPETHPQPASAKRALRVVPPGAEAVHLGVPLAKRARLALGVQERRLRTLPDRAEPGGASLLVGSGSRAQRPMR